jgi:hypothetical protein
MLTTLLSGSKGDFSVDGLFVCWLRSESDEFCEESRPSADVRLAPGRGLSDRVVVVGGT